MEEKFVDIDDKTALCAQYIIVHFLFNFFHIHNEVDTKWISIKADCEITHIKTHWLYPWYNYMEQRAKVSTYRESSLS